MTPWLPLLLTLAPGRALAADPAAEVGLGSYHALLIGK
jgi:hypothetical protein